MGSQSDAGLRGAEEPERHRGQCDHHRRGQHRQRHVHSQQQRTRQRPRGHETDSGQAAPSSGAVATGEPGVGSQPGQGRSEHGRGDSGPTLISSSFALTDGLALGCTLNLTN